MSTIENLNKSRGSLKRKITTIETFLNARGPYLKNCDLLNEKDLELDKIFEDYEEIKSKYEELINETNEESISAKTNEFEAQFWKVKGIIDEFREAINTAQKEHEDSRVFNEEHPDHNASKNALELLLQTLAGMQVNNTARVSVKVPELKLPTFSGKLEEWTTFIDSFESIIHNEEKYSNIDKYHYLSSCLSDDIKRDLLRRFQLSNDGYELALKYLKEKYSNNRAITNKYFAELFKAKSVEKENAKELRALLDVYSGNLEQAKKLNEGADMFDMLIIFMVSSRLDESTRKAWETQIKNKSYPTWDELKQFLEDRCCVLERVNFDKQFVNESKRPAGTTASASTQKQKTPYQAAFKQTTTTLIATEKSNSYSCALCKEEHKTHLCPEFIKMPVSSRVQKVKENRLCFNCLSPRHGKADCQSKARCRECAKSGKNNELHHTLLHYERFIKNNQEKEDNQQSQQSQQRVSTSNLRETTSSANSENISSVQAHCAYSVTSHHVFLLTAVIIIENKSGDPVLCRAMLDSGSQSNFVTERMAQIIGIKRESAPTRVDGISEGVAHTKQKLTAKIRSNHTNFSQNMEFLILRRIAPKIPNNRVPVKEIQIPDNIKLADPEFMNPNDIDILIGAEFFLDLILEGKIPLNDNVSLRASVFGWLVAGKLGGEQSNHQRVIRSFVSVNEQLNQSIRKFWELEEVSVKRILTEEEEYCEKLFMETTKRNQEGRFIVHLPARKSFDELMDNRSTALQRFFILEKKLAQHSEISEMYREFLREYEALGHMKELPSQEQEANEKCYYLPHHPVMKMESTTTKLRVVFDASCKAANKLSLNDTLCVGPVIQRDLFSIWIKFRTYQYAMTADAKMMYRQILIDKSQEKLQRIFWRSSVNQPLKCYALKTITYGTSPASFLSTRCLKQLSIDNETKFPIAAKAIAENMYMDDLLIGSQTLEGALSVQSEIIEIMESGKFHLRKWVSNHPEILRNLPTEDCEKLDSTSESIKALGLSWNPHSDQLSLRVVDKSKSMKAITKRSVLSVIASFFDPLGMEAPVVVVAKIFLQKLWQLKLGWDDPIPAEVQQPWEKFISEIDCLKQVRIDRFVLIEEYSRVEIHGYCDASVAAYGACIYMRSENKEGDVKSALLCAKSKVTPLDKRTLPELELCGAELLARLFNKVMESFQAIEISACYLWSDSTIVLAWIQQPANSFKTFVGNKVANIQRFSKDCDWRHVKSHLNPADQLSRGLNPNELVNNEFWFQGPAYLKLSCDNWPKSVQSEIQCFLSTVNNQQETHFIDSLLNITNSTSKLSRIVGYVLRFINNCQASISSRKKCINNEQKYPVINQHVQESKKTKCHREVSSLSVLEVSCAHETIIKLIQHQVFKVEVEIIKKGQPGKVIVLPKKSTIQSLKPFLDTRGILRVGGRLENSSQPFNEKHQIILPGSHRFTENIIREIHRDNMHPGQRATLSFIRQKYWPLRVKSVIKKVIRSCVTCLRVKPKEIQQLMGNLPSSRVQLQFPFFRTGVDYCGPFHIKCGTVRSTKIIKAYVSVFVCMATKAIHLELVSDMTTKAFLAALDRFFADHGMSRHMYSDNGSNFIGAASHLNSEMEQLATLLQSTEFKEAVISKGSNNNIEWHFIPPHAPEFGGLWEAGVKSTKHHLVRVLKNSLLTFEEMYTVLKRISSILNSRPLFPESDDINDYSAVTPGHFLIGRPNNMKPEIDIADVNLNRLDRWQRLQQLVQQFYKVWYFDYLHQLQQRSKRFNEVKINIGDLVLMVDDNVSAFKWPLARVIETHPGSDDVVRVVTVKTQSGTYKRPAAKICKLISIES